MTEDVSGPARGGAATRGEAVDLAVDAGLLEGFGPRDAAVPPRSRPSGA